MSGPRPLLPRLVLVFLLAAVPVAAAVGLFYYLRPADPPPPSTALVPDTPPPDPRETTDSPYRNIKPHVKYVGDAACAACHEETCKSYHAHPMGRSAEFIKGGTPLEKFPANGPAEFASGPFDFTVEKTADGMMHRTRLREPGPVPVPELAVPVQVAIGSGTRGRSYLEVDDGWVWQSAASWFGPEEKWDVSPGFRIGAFSRRVITPACLYCHVDHVEPVPGTQNRYRQPLFTRQAAVGCERCHGPGELHVSERADDPRPPLPDTSIVNPRHLSPALQLAVCEQCHLQGEERLNRRGRDAFEFRPGLRFEDFVSVYVRHPDIAEANKSVGQFEQMEQSKCFTKSGSLTCTSCHDPHLSPAAADKDAHYRQRCQTCHQPPGSKGCSAPQPERQAKNDSCIACHMTKAASANITHASVTDHRVPRTAGPPPRPRGLAFGTPPLLRFRPGSHLPAEELDRDLGIALARFGQKRPPADVLPGNLRLAAATLLKGSLARWPGDAEAWAAVAELPGERGEAAEKLKAAQAAVELTGGSEAALKGLAEAATAAERYDVAVEAADRWAKACPRSAEPLALRAFVHLRRGDWSRAEADCRAVLETDPVHAEMRLYLGICRHMQGDRAGGWREAQTAGKIESDPRERERLLEWYQRATR